MENHLEIIRRRETCICLFFKSHIIYLTFEQFNYHNTYYNNSFPLIIYTRINLPPGIKESDFNVK